MVTNTRMSLRIDKKIVNELKQKALAEGKSISQFIIDSKDYFDFVINDGLSLRVDYIYPIAEGSEIYRINIYFKETGTERVFRSLWYELWVHQEYVEDNLHTAQSPTRLDFAEFAFRFVISRYKESGNTLPKEFGAFVYPKRIIKHANSREDLWIWYDEAVNNK